MFSPSLFSKPALRSDAAISGVQFPLRTLVVCLLLTVCVVVSLLLWSTQSLRAQQQEAQAVSRMQYWRGQVLLFDEQLTMSARMAVATGRPSWIDRYNRVEPELERALNELELLSEGRGTLVATAETDAANDDLVAMEREAFSLLEAGEIGRARALLFSSEYRDLKSVYTSGMENLLARIDRYQTSLQALEDSGQRWQMMALVLASTFLVLLWWWYGRQHRVWRVSVAGQNQTMLHELDETRQKTASLEAELNDAEQRLGFVLDNSPIVIFSLSPEGIFESSNGAALKSMNLEPGEIVGRSVFEIYGDLPVMIANIKLALAGQSRRYEGRDRFGHFYESFLHPVARKDGRYDVVGVAFDVTESAAARRKASMLGEVLQHSPVGTAWIDSKGLFKYVNQGFCDITGFSRDTLLGQPWSVPLNNGARESEINGLRMDLLDEPGRKQSAELQITRGDGEIRWMKADAVARRMGQKLGVILAVEDITELRNTQSALTERTYSDGATGLPNRFAMLEWLRTVMSGSNASRSCTGALVYIDLDHFRRIHDVFGRLKADQFLRSVAQRLLDIVPTGGMLARSGGDEFLLYSPADSRTAVEELVEHLQSDLSSPFDFAEQEFTISASFGVAMLPEDARSAGEALRCAEAAMYTAKEQGRNCLSYFKSDLVEQPRRLLQIETRLRAAIRAEKLEVHYQPIMRLEDSAIVGCEALLRWTDDELGVVSPGEFIQVAEELNLMSDLTHVVFNTAARDVADWNRALGRKLRVAINCSAQQLGEAGFCDLLLQTLSARRLQPSQFELEVTERVVMSQSAQVSESINRLVSEGFRLAIDDFGTGYSALAYLKRYPFHTVKIDRSFVRDITNRPADEALCRAIVGITEALHMDTVAEGLETREQVAALKALRSGYGQGFYFAPAMPAEQFLEWARIRQSGSQRATA